MTGPASGFGRRASGRQAAACLLLTAYCLLLCGCFGYSQNDNEWTVTFGTSLAVKQVGPKDTDQQAVVGIDLPKWMRKPFVEYFIDTDGNGVADQSGDPKASNEPPAD